MNVITVTPDEERCAAGARAVALDQIESAALSGDRLRMEFWVDRLVDRARRGLQTAPPEAHDLGGEGGAQDMGGSDDPRAELPEDADVERDGRETGEIDNNPVQLAEEAHEERDQLPAVQTPSAKPASRRARPQPA